MISFIVIGRNEEEHLNKCFVSIKKAIQSKGLLGSEIIYVDSNSSDNSIQIAKNNQVDQIFKLTKIYNAAMGRNIGAMYAKSSIYCFLDGDMEIYSDFFDNVLNENKVMTCDICSGDLLEIFYDNNNNVIKEKRAFEHIVKPFKKPITGGSFIIKADIYKELGGMDNRFRCSEDPEFGLRLAKKGYLLTFIPKLYVNHNTLKPPKRTISSYFRFNWLYGNLFMYKKNLFNKYAIRSFMFNNSSFILLILSLIISYWIGIYALFIYVLGLFIRIKFKFNKSGINKFFYHIIIDISMLIMFIPFYKKKIYTIDIPFEKI